MGDISAKASIERVINTHARDLIAKFMEDLTPEAKATVVSVGMTNEVYAIETAWILDGGVTLPGPSIDIDTLADWYPDCNVGY